MYPDISQQSKPTICGFSTVRIIHYHENILTKGFCKYKLAQKGLNSALHVQRKSTSEKSVLKVILNFLYREMTLHVR
jgi:hypothetical protein